MTDLREKIKAKIDQEVLIYYRETMGEKPEGWEDEITVYEVAADIWAEQITKVLANLLEKRSQDIVRKRRPKTKNKKQEIDNE